MEMRHCPVSGLPMVQEVNGLWHNSGCCCYPCKTLGWSNQDLDMAYEWRARLIAETIKPIYKTLSKHYPKIAGHVIGLEKSGETIAHAQWAELARDFFEAENHARALVNYKSVKTNEETT